MPVIKLHIDLTELDKTRFYRKDKNHGTDKEHHVYADFIAIETPRGNSDFMIKQATTKEEYESEKNLPFDQKTNLPIIGSGFHAGKKPPPKKVEPPKEPEIDGDVPF